jgi:non-homologous end joining protein Ku
VSKKSVSFNQLDERTMSRIRLKKVSAETGDDVPDEHIIKGYELSEGPLRRGRPRRARAVHPVATKSIDLEEFVDLDEIDPVYFDTPYIVARQDPEAVRAARTGDGGGRQGGDRAVRDAQQAVRVRRCGHRTASC